MRRSYAVTVAAMVLAAQLAGPANADPTFEQLEAISTLLDANDVSGLRRYIAAHPDLIEGTSDLAMLLARYMAESSDMVAFLGLEPLSDDDNDDDLSGLAALVADEMAPPDETPGPAPEPEPSLY